MPITGKVATTISRGQVVVADGEFRGSAGHGAFLSRDLNQYLV
jgi:dihydropyrimidinase